MKKNKQSEIILKFDPLQKGIYKNSKTLEMTNYQKDDVTERKIVQ